MSSFVIKSTCKYCCLNRESPSNYPDESLQTQKLSSLHDSVPRKYIKIVYVVTLVVCSLTNRARRGGKQTLKTKYEHHHSKHRLYILVLTIRLQW